MGSNHLPIKDIGIHPEPPGPMDSTQSSTDGQPMEDGLALTPPLLRSPSLHEGEYLPYPSPNRLFTSSSGVLLEKPSLKNYNCPCDSVETLKEPMSEIPERNLMLIVRRARLEDLESITDIYNEAVLKTVATFDTSSERYVEEFLYDLEADPHELKNLIGIESHRDVAEEMRQRLIRRIVEAGEPAPTIEPAPTRPTEGDDGAI